MLLALPISVTAAAVACNSLGQARTAFGVASRAASGHDRPPDGLLVEALAETKRRIAITGHPLTAQWVPRNSAGDYPRALRPDLGWVVELVAVDDKGSAPLAAAVLVSQNSNMVGVTFWPGPGPAGWTRADAEAGIFAAFGDRSQPGGAAGLDAAAVRPSPAAWSDMAPGGVPYASLVPGRTPVEVPSALSSELESFLRAWMIGDQAALRRIGNHTGSSQRGWWGTAGWQYAPGSATILSSLSGGGVYLSHVRFGVIGPQGAALLTDLEVVGRLEGELPRWENAFRIGDFGRFGG